MPENEYAGDEDWGLAASARQGDEDAYAELVSRHQTPIHRFIYRYVGDEETARDLAQEVFVKAWFALDRVKAKARFGTWLFQIALNLCRDHAKSRTTRWAQRTTSLVKLSSEGEEQEREFPHPGAAPDELAQHAEQTAVLEEEIAGLPGNLRESFLLGAIEGHPYKEVGAMLGLSSAKAVEVRIFRARRMLADRLAQRGFGASGL